MSSHPFSSWKTQIVTGRLEYKNEILAAFMDSMMIAHVPDLIGVVDVTGMPLQNTRYETGYRSNSVYRDSACNLASGKRTASIRSETFWLLIGLS